MARPQKEDRDDVAQTVSIRMTARDLATLDALVQAVKAELGAYGATASRASIVLSLIRREVERREQASPSAPNASPTATAKPSPKAAKPARKGAPSPKGKR